MTEYEKMGGTYRQTGNYILSNLTVGRQGMTHIGVLQSNTDGILKNITRLDITIC